jgi:hypothetical protein
MPLPPAPPFISALLLLSLFLLSYAPPPSSAEPSSHKPLSIELLYAFAGPSEHRAAYPRSSPRLRPVLPFERRASILGVSLFLATSWPITTSAMLLRAWRTAMMVPLPCHSMPLCIFSCDLLRPPLLCCFFSHGGFMTVLVSALPSHPASYWSAIPSQKLPSTPLRFLSPRLLLHCLPWNAVSTTKAFAFLKSPLTSHPFLTTGQAKSFPVHFTVE